jgi:predicted O-linked N-acetylglucosamine transferase (SPINDLY family)
MVDRWTSIADLDDEAAATAIRDDEIDVLVGLAPHTAGNRPRILAYRPAPVQAALYDVGSTGLRQVDLWLTDRVLHPSDTKERFVERLAYLPTLYLHAKPEGAPPPGPPPSLAQAPITFGSCNNPAKLSASTVALWSHVLHAVPNSRLMLKFGDRFRDSDVVRIVGGRFADRGIGAERLWLRGGALDRIRQLALLHDVDIALDPVPFNGCTTTFEALWMGVPVVTLAGDRFVGRIGASLLTASGIPELIADTPDDYVAKAAALAQDGDRLAGYRRDLRARVEASLLCDSAAHARAVEAVLRAAWHEWCRRQ